MSVAERFQGANSVVAGQLSPYWGEHAARYAFATPQVIGARVLDIACGTGYGLGMLMSEVGFICGVDIDAASAAQARGECGTNAGVLLGNGLQLPFAEGTFDVVTSFETLEHLHGRIEFLSELRRVLRPGGKLILSTPNALYTQPVNGVPANQFHIHEYEPDELRSELQRAFEIVEFLGQDLDASIAVSPFFEGQKRMPRDPVTQAKLLGWKVLNKVPLTARERLSRAVWGKPFYPTERDYVFSADLVESAPTLVAVCVRK